MKRFGFSEKQNFCGKWRVDVKTNGNYHIGKKYESFMNNLKASVV